MQLQSGSTQCSVEILTPQGVSRLFGPASRGGFLPWDTSAPRSGGLMAVETENDLAQACGGFTLVLEGLHDSQGRRWDQRIPMRSLVYIHLERTGSPDVPEVDPTVMIGLTSSHVAQESYGEAAPQRTVQIRGRAINCLLLDATLVYNAMLAGYPAYGTLSLDSAQFGSLLSSLSMDPLRIREGSPLDIVKTLLNEWLYLGSLPQPPLGSPILRRPGDTPTPGVTPTVAAAAPVTAAVPVQMPGPAQQPPQPQHPLISLDLPVPLWQVLDPNYDAWNTFEPVKIYTAPSFPAPVNSLYNYLRIFIDPAFQEFFARIEDGRCALHLRGKPFLHAHIGAGTRFKASGDEATVATEPTLQTFVLDPADIVHMQVQRDAGNVYNYFEVVPRGMTDSVEGPWVSYNALPQVVTDPRHPSFVGRYGIRRLRIETPYLNAQAFSPSPAVSGQTPQPGPLLSVPAGAGDFPRKAASYAAHVGMKQAHIPWFMAMIHVESGFDPNPGGAPSKNPNGSLNYGIAQFSPPFPSNVGVNTIADAMNPDIALPGAARYWLQLEQQFGSDPPMIIAAYNAGPGAVLAAKGIPQASVAHIAKVSQRVPLYAGYGGTTAAPLASLPPSQTGTAPPTTASAPAPDDQKALGVVQVAQRWSALQMAWYDMGGELFGGTIVVRGHAAWNIGHRVVGRDDYGPWEAYIEGVHHAYVARTGQFLTTLRITRGWYLNPSITQQLWSEGQTQIRTTSGGPPLLDPQTGAPQAPPSPFGLGEGEVGVEILDQPDLGILGPGGQPFQR